MRRGMLGAGLALALALAGCGVAPMIQPVAQQATGAPAVAQGEGDRAGSGRGAGSRPLQEARPGGITDEVVSPEVEPVLLGIEEITPEGGDERYGVGMPVIVRFTQDVPERSRAAVQAAATVRASQPLGPAMWSWLDDDTMAFRPKDFWPGKTTVVVRLELAGLDLGETSDDRPLVGFDNERVRFRIGREQITKINLGKQMGVAYQLGEPQRTFPVSTGKAGWRTRQGIKVIHERVYNKVFTNDAVGDFTEDYRLVSRYALRLTSSGEFLHSAPWALGRLGVYAGSHGCTNVSDADAAWFFERALYGDPVIYVGDDTAPEMETSNGLGGVWNYTWAQWKKDTAGPSRVVISALPPLSKPAPAGPATATPGA